MIFSRGAAFSIMLIAGLAGFAARVGAAAPRVSRVDAFESGTPLGPLVAQAKRPRSGMGWLFHFGDCGDALALAPFSILTNGYEPLMDAAFPAPAYRSLVIVDGELGAAFDYRYGYLDYLRRRVMNDVGLYARERADMFFYKLYIPASCSLDQAAAARIRDALNARAMCRVARRNFTPGRSQNRA